MILKSRKHIEKDVADKGVNKAAITVLISRKIEQGKALLNNFLKVILVCQSTTLSYPEEKIVKTFIMTTFHPLNMYIFQHIVSRN